MKKFNLILLILIAAAPITSFLLCSKGISTVSQQQNVPVATPASNLIYLHEHKKTTRSSLEQLKSLSNVGNVVLQFYADWCGPCNRLSPLITAVASTMPNITFIKINRDFFVDLATAFNIHSIPTLIFLHDGSEISRYDGGPVDTNALTQLITKTFKNRT